jgi:hypothetical protein
MIEFLIDDRLKNNIKFQNEPPVEEPPNRPQKPPVEEPEDTPEPPPPPSEPPVKEPPNEPGKPPVKEPPPKDPDREPPQKTPVRVRHSDQTASIHTKINRFYYEGHFS